MNFGAPELIIVLLVVLLLFGGAKLPQLARSLGQAKKEFHEGAAESRAAEAKAAEAKKDDATS
ncbi:MAG TPA: twin-arginine translocase TatA/TatE family subunit [Acidimicrobiales bacterium]|nr:twin-arginine translocase TatA/TatE family subunit [Acidimicrobiales bacterium]